MESEDIPHSSFFVKRISPTTFLVVEDDVYAEYPYIYVKLHPRAPIIILSDTGSDEPSEEKKHARFTQLRDFLENSPVEENNHKPLNPDSARQYVIICTHCHYDHIGGITQFLAGGTTEVIASAAGRDFIESDLERHGQFKDIGRPVPYFAVTRWAQAFERLYYDSEEQTITTAAAAATASHHAPQDRQRFTDLALTILHTPGHTPDELAWYDHAELHLYVGDSVYEEGEEGMAIEWPGDGNLVEWAFSMQKLRAFVRAENARVAGHGGGDDDGAAAGGMDAEDRDGDWVPVARRVKLGAGHTTHSADAEDLLARVEAFWWRAVKGDVPVVRKAFKHGEVEFTWREGARGKSKISFIAPARLMDDARKFFVFPGSAQDS